MESEGSLHVNWTLSRARWIEYIPYFIIIYFKAIFSSTTEAVPLLLTSDQNSVRIYHVSHACYMLHSSDPPLFDHSGRAV
jgi:hypothetical protein